MTEARIVEPAFEPLQAGEAHDNIEILSAGSSIALNTGGKKGICARPFFTTVDYGVEIAHNVTTTACKGCAHLHVKDTIAWKGACGKHVTVKNCTSMSPCTGKVSGDIFARTLDDQPANEAALRGL